MNIKPFNLVRFVQSRTNLFNAFVNRFPEYASNKTTACQDLAQQYNWQNSKLGISNQFDRNFFLPGNVSLKELVPYNVTSNNAATTTTTTTTTKTIEPSDVLMQFEMPSMNLKYIPPEDSKCNGDYIRDCNVLECIVQICPLSMRKAFSSLITDHNIMEGNFTIITITQQTVNDMATYNKDVVEEREKLHKSFMEGAEIIRESLKKCDFWANYIDTSNGKLHFPGKSGELMLETDERYRLLGFEIEDMICCKVISHHVWGTHAYVGCLFTNVPCNHPLLHDLAMKTITSTI